MSLLTVALGQTVYAADDTQMLDEVVVSGSRTSEKLSETPVSIGVVDDKALKRDKPKTMGDVINRIAGVTWVDLGNEQHMMGIRQPNSTNAVYQYLEDGIPIRPLGVFNHNSLNELNLAGAEHVEVIKGAASSLYGSNAIGGAVNFITERPSQTPYVSVGVRRDNVNGFDRIDTGASDSWGDFGLRFSQYSSRRSRDNWQQYSNGSKDSFTLRGDYALSGTSLIHATVSYNDLDSATPGSLDPVDYHSNSGKSYQTFSWRKDKATRVNVQWEGETTHDGLTTATLFSRQDDHGQLPNYTISACAISATCLTGYHGTINNNGVKSLGIDMKHQQELAWLSSRLIAGLYYDQSPNSYWSNNLDVTRDAATRVYTGQVASTTYLTGTRDYKADIKNTALFVQWESSPLDKTRLVVGGRSDNINYDFTNNLTPSANFGAPNESRSYTHFSPKVGATYSLSNRASMYANVSEGFRPPEVSELYSKSAVPDLEPSTYDNLELGLRMAFLDGALKLDSAIYRLEGHDTIVSYTPAVGSSFNKNAGHTRSQGLEANLAWDSGAALDGRMGFSLASHRYVQYHVKDSVPVLDYSGKEMPIAPDTFTAEIGYKPVTDGRVALEVVRQGGYWMNNANTVRYAGHTLLNLRANYQFAGGWEAWLQGRNLTNRLYADNASSSYSGTGTYTPSTVGTTAGMDSYSVGAPRSLMVGLIFAFGSKK